MKAYLLAVLAAISILATAQTERSTVDDVTDLMDDDEEMYFTLDSCETIDKKLTKRVTRLLKQELATKENEGATLTERQSSMCMEILKATLQEGGMGSQWATSKVEISGDYSVHRGCKPTVYDGNVGGSDRYYNDNKTETYNQVIFSGYLPSDNPRYAICVTMDKKGDECSEKEISNTVNKIAEYLNKHMKFQ